MRQHQTAHTTAIAGACILLCTAVGTLCAATIVDWGGDYLSGDKLLAAGGYDAVNDDFGAISPVSDYTGPEIAGRLSDTGNDMRMVNSGTSDRVQLKTELWALVLFQKETFLADGDTLTVNFDATSQVTTNLNTNTGRDNYLVIRSGSAYYRSDEIWTGTGTKILTPTSLSWFAYDPVTDPSDLSGGSATIVSGGLISDIQAVGIFNEKVGGSEATRWDSFEVTGIVIPEPASLLVLLMATGCLLCKR